MRTMRCWLLIYLSLVGLVTGLEQYQEEEEEESNEVELELEEEENPLSDRAIARINSFNTTWKAGRNFPEYTSYSELSKDLFGVSPEDEKYIRETMARNMAVFTGQLPQSFDSREKWPYCPTIGIIRDQGACGSCWAVSSVQVMTDRLCIHSGGKEQFVFSADNLMACCPDCAKDCSKGFTAKAWQYWITDGIVSGGHYHGQGCQPYSLPPCRHARTILPFCRGDGVKPKCSKSCSNPAHPNSYEEDIRYGASTYRVGADEKSIREEIFSNGPVVASFRVYSDFASYKSGVYQVTDKSKRTRIRHAVKLIGWGHENGVPYWLAVNSWNDMWGDSGLFKILRGANMCGIESSVVTGLPKL